MMQMQGRAWAMEAHSAGVSAPISRGLRAKPCRAGCYAGRRGGLHDGWVMGGDDSSVMGSILFLQYYYLQFLLLLFGGTVCGFYRR